MDEKNSPEESSDKEKTVDENEQDSNNCMESVKEASQSSQEIKFNENTESKSKEDNYSENVTYNENGDAIYSDPKSNYKYKWCKETNSWSLLEEDGKLSSNPYENEHYRWCTETNKWVLKNPSKEHDIKDNSKNSKYENEFYKWDSENNKWIPKEGVVLPNSDGNRPENVTYGFEDGVHIYTEKDGSVFFWDIEKKAWFPKIDDDFMARYQMNYGFIDNTTITTTRTTKDPRVNDEKENKIVKLDDEKVAAVKRKASAEPPKWFEIPKEKNTKVYVSNLPEDITEDEFAELMGKCGMIMKDPQSQKYKVKLYMDSNKMLKGDGLCDYIKVESVDLALNILDGYDVRGKKIKVQQAKFELRGEYNPSLKPKKKKKDKVKLLKLKEKLFDWRPEKMRGERSKHERVVILKNLFEPELFEKEVALILEYQNDLRDECSKCGTVRKVIIFDRHPEGVAQVSMGDPDEADLVVQMMRGRYFGQRRLTAELWDGKTKYKIEETDVEAEKRLSKWDNYLETDEHKNNELGKSNEKQPGANKECDVNSLVNKLTETSKSEELKLEQ